ncbi:acyltransferase [soil metagenome]
MIHEWENKIFDTAFFNFEKTALEIFQYQYANNEVYKEFVENLQVDPGQVKDIQKIPFLPISFFKSHMVTTHSFEPEAIFESSGTSGSINSKHYVRSIPLYKDIFHAIFQMFYGDVEKWCILALLPSYLERKNSSLVLMADELIKRTGNPLSGFYLDDHEKLYHTLLHNEIAGQKTLLLGVTFGLLDFAEKYKMQLHHTTVMETGGMKGRRKEMIRTEVQELLKKSLGMKNIHSEYGMTELLSQAYAKHEGFFETPSWMRVLIREEDDPKNVRGISKNEKAITGLLNIIDLGNIHSCCFIATDDVGRLHPDETFEVLGRSDISDMRGCSLMVI